LPADLSIPPEPDDWENGIWLGDHSFSWLTLRELKEYDYDQETMKCGVISEAQYIEHKATGELPNSWSGGVSGWAHETVSPDEMDKIIAGTRKREIRDPQSSCLVPRVAATLAPTGVSYSVRIWWRVKYRDVARMILNEMIPAMEKVADGDLDSVRVVFGFDS
jgi:hypothetical protein